MRCVAAAYVSIPVLGSVKLVKGKSLWSAVVVFQHSSDVLLESWCLGELFTGTIRL